MSFYQTIINRLLITTSLLVVSSISYASYGIPASTGSGLPYSVETKNLIKDLFDNRTIVGGQVIALKDQPGKDYSGNYIDIGSLAGVNMGDVFAFFTPQGEPVGFGRIVEVQRYTSSFSFIELTVDPTDNLIGKKVPEEIKIRLSSGKSIDLPMGRFKKSVAFVKRKNNSIVPPNISNQSSIQPNNSSSEQSVLPPLPGDSTTTTGSNTSTESTASNGGPSLPELPMDNTGAVNTPSPLSSGGELPPLNTGDNNLPALPDSNSNTLPPLNNSSTLPGIAPSDNSSATLPPLSENSSISGDTNSSLPLLTAGDTTMSSSGTGLPGMDNSGGLPPATSSTLPGMDNGGLPPADGTASLPGMPDTTMAAAPGTGLPGMDNSGGLPPMANNSLPMVSADSSLPSALPAPEGTLPPVDSTIPNGFPPTTMGSLPSAMDINAGQMAPPDVSATLPPMIANASSAPIQNSPASSNYQPSDLDIPAVPSKVNSEYLQDIPTLSSSKKPAA